jgi:hypothetical protein
MSPKILPGRANPLGATPTADGTNFLCACLDADGVETRLCARRDTRAGLRFPSADPTVVLGSLASATRATG